MSCRDISLGGHNVKNDIIVFGVASVCSSRRFLKQLLSHLSTCCLLDWRTSLRRSIAGLFRWEFCVMTDRLRCRFTEANNSFSRRRFLATSAAIAGGIGATSLIGSSGARAATLKTVRFSEAVHNLGYINLYVGMHAGIFKKTGLDMQVSAAGGDTQTSAAVLGGSADFAIRDATMAQISREDGGAGVGGG